MAQPSLRRPNSSSHPLRGGCLTRPAFTNFRDRWSSFPWDGCFVVSLGTAKSPIRLGQRDRWIHWRAPESGPYLRYGPSSQPDRVSSSRLGVSRQLDLYPPSGSRHYPGRRCCRVLAPNLARPLSRAAAMINVRGAGTFSSFVAVRRTMSHSCRRATSGSIRDARLAGA